MTGILMDKESGKELLIGGKQVTAEAKFTPKAADGSVELTFTFDGSALANKSVVAFETVSEGEHPVAIHAEITDEGQTVHIPDAHTTATDAKTGSHTGLAEKEVTVNDVVKYENLIPGKTYTVEGKLMDKATGNPFLADGKEVTASAEFTAEKANGSVTITFTFSGKELAGKSVVAFETVKYEGKEVAVHADINDEDQTVDYPEIGTTATDTVTEDHIALAAKEVIIKDVVEYKNLTPDKEYTIDGILMDQATGEKLLVEGEEVHGVLLDADGQPVEGNKFTPDKADGSVELTFTFDGSALANKSLVAFETVYEGEHPVAIHAEITDEGQTVQIPDAHTTATDAVSGTHTALYEEEITITDVVKYENLIPGKTYTIDGVLMDKATEEPLLVDGKEVHGIIKTDAVEDEPVISGTEDPENTDPADPTVVEPVEPSTGDPAEPAPGEGTDDPEETPEPAIVNEFTPEEANGEVILTFTFKGTELEGKTTVAFETVYYEGKEVIIHADINDKDQTVSIPKIRTTAVDSKSGTHNALAGKEVTILDTVAYKGLDPDKTYTIDGILMDQTDAEGKTPLMVEDKEVHGILLDANGKPMEENKFSPEEPDGEVVLAFTFDGSALAGKSVVVFENVYDDDKLIGVHADITDEGQTVHFPDVHTTAKDKKSDSHTALAEKTVTIEDTVVYTNLIPGKEYTVDGILMDKVANKPAKSGGKEITSSVKFTPKEADGEVVLTFTFSGLDLEGRSVVAFETLKEEDVAIGVHADINDEDQTVNIPKIRTSAKDKADKDQTVKNEASVTIVDTVTYENLTPGETYKVSGILMDQATGKPVKVNGKELTAETQFKAEKANGSVDVTFTFDASGLGGHKLVVFETMTNAQTNAIVAEHKDLKDKNQTITVTTTPKTTKPDTGDTNSLFGWMLLGLIAGGAGLVSGTAVRRRKRNEGR